MRHSQGIINYATVHLLLARLASLVDVQVEGRWPIWLGALAVHVGF